MKRNGMKRKWRRKSAASVFFLLVLWAVPVLAGDINAAEQTIIDYYNQTFTYDGKTYVASEAAKASVYQKLASDGTDLTESQAQAAIRQASKNIKKGIADGYLVEVMPADEKENTENSVNTESVSDTEKDADTSQNTDIPNAAGTELLPETKDKGTQEKPESSDFDKEDGEERQPNMIDVENLLLEVQQQGEEYSLVQTGETSSVTVEQYLEGKLTAVSGDGTLLFEGELPLKNTGYNTGNLLFPVIAAGILFALVLLAGFICIQKENHKK